MQEAEKKKREKETRKRKLHRSCTVEFDFTGWSTYNSWRTDMRDMEPRVVFRSRYDERKEEGRQERDCWRDCEFPSQCFNEKQKEDVWAQMRRLWELEEDAGLGIDVE